MDEKITVIESYGLSALARYYRKQSLSIDDDMTDDEQERFAQVMVFVEQNSTECYRTLLNLYESSGK